MPEVNKYKEKNLRTADYAKAEIYKIINVNSVVNAITGDIYKGGHIPEGVEDLINIAINSISMPMDERAQEGTFNVNAYVPFISHQVRGRTVSIPDTEKEAEISSILMGLLKEFYSKFYNIYIEYQTVIKNQEAKINIVNFRVKFTNHQY